MYDVKRIYEAYTIDEAIQLKKEHPEARYIAGGSDVLVKIREGKMAGLELISLYLIDELRGVSMEEDGTIRIGSLTSFTHITNDEIIQKYINTLGEAVDTAGGPQLRNIATIGGNICNAAPSADSCTTVMAYDAIIELKGENGYREVPVKDFYIKYATVDIRETEIVTAIKIKKESYENHYGHYFKYAMRNAMDIATSTASANVKFDENNKVEEVRISYGVAAAIPVRAFEAEKTLVGRELTDNNINVFAKKALDELSPRDSWRASKALRTQILYEITTRCLKEIRKKHEEGLNA
ncbi:xanthine dehydrogenase FAD-binding subunit XdhB [Anaerococcus vaginalis]|uniref:FAD binding domain in molybdopterin dehydrogenase n=2 Tax=Anaerococcus vaginalis TaxID=33037 RepID=C7HVM4_9FIRM|nr:xanthine dehydrogenase subunit XdhB [Anaerococcus vaginalis]EEU12029.1 FAD binding domain in molybdopterin dehydrogenase [Anaerococcus vaginalis ATCC 51170]QQB61669.1 xanthine dehydrogenase FAD-binding subunit XdhB [Anaerococcus vaginalis]